MTVGLDGVTGLVIYHVVVAAAQCRSETNPGVGVSIRTRPEFVIVLSLQIASLAGAIVLAGSLDKGAGVVVDRIGSGGDCVEVDGLHIVGGGTWFRSYRRQRWELWFRRCRWS